MHEQGIRPTEQGICRIEHKRGKSRGTCGRRARCCSLPLCGGGSGGGGAGGDGTRVPPLRRPPPKKGTLCPPQPNLAIARVRPLNKATDVGNSRLRLGEERRKHSPPFPAVASPSPSRHFAMLPMACWKKPARGRKSSSLILDAWPTSRRGQPTPRT